MKYPLFNLDTGAAGGAPAATGTPSIDSAIDAIGAAPPAAAAPAPAPVAPATPEPASAAPDSKPADATPPSDDPFASLRTPAKKPDADPEPAKQHKPGSLAEFRENYERTKKELETERKLKEELRVALTEGTKKEVAEARAALQKERDEIKAKYDEMESKVRLLDYAKSNEYVSKYQQPINAAWASAKETMAELRVDDGNGGRRAATGSDLARIMQMDGAEAREEARRVFGEDSGDVLALRRNILGLYKAADDAVADWKTKGSEAQEASQREEREHHGKLESEFEGHLSRVRTEMADIYDYDQKDVEADKFVKETERFIGIAFKGKGLPDGLTPTERSRRIAITQAEVAARARAWAPQIIRAKRAESRVAELEAELKQLRGTEPGPGGSAVPAAAAAVKAPDWQSAIDMLPAGRR